MAMRPQFEIELFGLRIRYWGHPAKKPLPRKLAVDIPHEENLKRFVKWMSILLAVWQVQTLQGRLLAAAALTMQHSVVQLLLGLVMAITALVVFWATIRRL